jgi:hypothetical protein
MKLNETNLDMIIYALEKLAREDADALAWELKKLLQKRGAK